MKKVKKVKVNDVCNFSKFPCTIYENPLLKITNEIINSISPTFVASKDHKINLSEFYNLDIKALNGYNSDCIFLPWTHYLPSTKFKDSFFKIFLKEDYFKKEVEKTQMLLNSISSHGYRPDKFNNRQGGEITGYFLEHLGEKVFYVVSGNHRAAVLSSLSFGEMSFLYSSNTGLKDRDICNVDVKVLGNKVYSSDNVANWPCVRSGFLNEGDALCIMKTYFI